MYEFCTLFDRNYLARGLVLHQSLMTRGGDFNLRVFCMDDETARLLRLLDLPRLEIVSLEELESLDSGLAEVKATAVACRVHVDRDAGGVPCGRSARHLALREITYLDADLQILTTLARSSRRAALQRRDRAPSLRAEMAALRGDQRCL